MWFMTPIAFKLFSKQNIAIAGFILFHTIIFTNNSDPWMLGSDQAII